MTIWEDAPAKINLYLHVGPVRDDGLHDLASLFVFTQKGDRIGVDADDDISLKITGPFADALAAFPREDNLVMRAAHALRSKTGLAKGAAITLEKNLPIAAGVGGGSADAAATLRALERLWGVQTPTDDLNALAFALGADVPACLRGAPILVEGAGEMLRPAPPLPPLSVCLANPGIEMPTGPVFRDFDRANPAPPAPTHPMIDVKSPADIAAFLNATRNDLEPPARALSGDIASLLERLRAQPGALAARMSGSGATCFALFANLQDADAAAARFRQESIWALASPLASA